MSRIKKSGRPSVNDNKRGKLIIAARKLFVLYDYDKVSIRAIATEAGVDSALIRYYFQSKLGLFTAIVQETAEPVLAQFNKLSNDATLDSASELMKTYYGVMSQNPDFPKLIFKIASMPDSAQNQGLKSMIANALNPKHVKPFSVMHEQGLLQDHVDPLCLHISFFSMMVFPFLMPDLFKKALQIEITPEFMAHLAIQNSKLLEQGCINQLPNKDIS
jgi:AcrR family transcriptional regulator